MLQELQYFIKSILYWIFVLFLFSFLFFIPIFSNKSITTLVFRNISERLLPPNVEFVVTDPLSAFVSHLTISITLAFLVTFPFLLYGIMSYLSPVLSKIERTKIFKVLVPSTLLFISGCIFAYYFIIPITFKLLYEFAVSIEATQFFLVNEFIYLVAGLMVITGILFLLPIFMIFLTFIGLVEKGFWLKKWRQSLLFFLIFSAVITPDGTGITMLLLSIPLIALYSLGCIITRQK